MIANPHITFVRYDPYSKQMTREEYAHEIMQNDRQEAIRIGRSANHFGVILGTLGRQGNPEILERLIKRLETAGKTYTIVLLTEIFPSKLKLFHDIDAYVFIIEFIGKC